MVYEKLDCRRDLENNTIEVMRRDTLEKETITGEEFMHILNEA